MTQVCRSQSPCPCGRPPLTRTSTADAQTQFYLSLCGVPGSQCSRCLFEPSDHLWWKWSLILNANSSLLPSCWDFSFDPCIWGISSPPLQLLLSYWGFSDLGHVVLIMAAAHFGCGVSPLHYLLQCCTAGKSILPLLIFMGIFYFSSLSDKL